MRKNNFLMVYKDKRCLIIFICRGVTSVHKYMICLQFCYAESFQPQKFCWKMLFEAGHFRGRPFDFWEGGRGGGIGDFGKKYPADWFQGGKNLARKYPGEKSSCTEKKISHGVSYWKKSLALLYVREKILSLEVWRKKFLPKPSHPYPPSPSKVKLKPRAWAFNGQALKLFFFFHFLQCLSLLFSYMVWKIPSPYTNIYLNSIKVVHDNNNYYNNSYCWRQRYYKRGGSTWGVLSGLWC